jgi:serine/threonine protein phosphatase PrpC
MLEAYGLSDPGCVRQNNEDYFISDRRSGIFILADGMGGANAGEFASSFSAERIYKFLLDAAGGEANGFGQSLRYLEQGFLAANSAVREAASSNPELQGMGTTLLVVRDVGDHHLQIGSVGDSRAYLFSNGKLSLITEDQTWVAEVGTRLGLSDETLRKHPMRHVLTMAVGTAEQLRIFSSVVEVSPGDQILLCSDGLHGVCREKIINDTLDSGKSLQEKCHYLVEAAKKEGGPDNVTVILIQLT